MRKATNAVLAFVLLNTLGGFGTQAVHAQGDSNAPITLDTITNTVREMCLHPDRMGDYVRVTGSVDAGFLVNIIGMDVVGTVELERWTGLGETLRNFDARAHVECTQHVLPILLEAFGVVHYGCRNIRTVGFGGFGGVQFDSVESRTLRLRSGDYVDAIILNEVHYGGQGGRLSGTLQLGPEEYITNVVIRSGRYVDRLVFTTNLGNSLIGGSGGGVRSTLDNIRVLRIGGRSGAYLDRIDLTYCELD